ncbi:MULTISPECIES: TetR/AcrR family transcriptional regulator [unclassified Shewanella]|uniref:TetR/AcrR family transcriptional regulator n=1 Tax=unclassified Shewanella TaxID=196818 RepID=UPI000C851BD9|nr:MULTISPECIES: TetR/AcrR family transcriptional regulator [unclassified Shewanella]MDO6619947.1 TetR/AcrR family transcriptional regulator [Shewanella sp. 6_MG-2023]PMH86153.1 TetR family transcriptional regulator [Shewanella sp. 10N.286.48.B5]PMH98997.1 TetR family transcriptional regulator [Shewanella sp. 10N.286.48.A6]
MTITKKTLSQQKHEAIVDAAKRMFKKLGVAATSMDKLAEEAQVSKRTVYNHFATKEALVMHLVSELWFEAMASNQGQYQPQQALFSQLSAIILTEIQFMNSREHIDMARVAIGHLFYNSEEMVREIEKMKQHETAILRWIKAAALDGRIQIEDAMFANEQLLHLIKGQCFWPQILTCNPLLNDQQRQHLADESAKMFLARYEV